MKRILMFVLCSALLLSATLSSFAALTPSSEDITMVYTNNCDGVTVVPSEGKAEGKLPNGTEFSVDKVPEGGENLRIYPVHEDEKSVQDWIDSALTEDKVSVITYYVSLVDEKGDDLSNKGITVTVQAPKSDEDLSVYAVGSDGKATAVDFTAKGDKITFTANGSFFYSFAYLTDNPDTADFQFACYIVASFVAVAGCVFLVVRRKKA